MLLANSNPGNIHLSTFLVSRILCFHQVGGPTTITVFNDHHQESPTTSHQFTMPSLLNSAPQRRWHRAPSLGSISPATPPGKPALQVTSKIRRTALRSPAAATESARPRPAARPPPDQALASGPRHGHGPVIRQDSVHQGVTKGWINRGWSLDDSSGLLELLTFHHGKFQRLRMV